MRGDPLPPIIFERLKLPQQIIYQPVNMPLVHVSRVFHLFLNSPIFIITETRSCRNALENSLPIYLILVYRVSIVKL